MTTQSYSQVTFEYADEYFSDTAFRFKKHNFRCNILCPGAVKSNIRDAVDPRETDFEAAEVFK